MVSSTSLNIEGTDQEETSHTVTTVRNVRDISKFGGKFFLTSSPHTKISRPMRLAFIRLPADCIVSSNANRCAKFALSLREMSDSRKKPGLDKLSTLQFKVTQEKLTERPFTGKFNNFKELGTYECLVCGQELFKSEHKFESGCGWPAFFDSIDPSRIKEIHDDSHGMDRTEVLCSRCDAHLGHVFNDGPKPTRRRFCINSVSMRFRSPKGEVVEDEG